MNTLKGPFRLIMKEMKMIYYINVGVTIALMALYIFLSYYLGENEHLGVTFGPFYAIFLIFPFILFKGYKYILSLGGTRKQFMIATYLSIGIYIVLSGMLLNGLHFLSPYLLNDGYIFHMADLVNGSHSLLYVWIDVLWMIILFGVGMIAQSIYFNLGTVRTLSSGAALLIAILATYFFADLGPLIEFIIVDHLLFVHILAGISVLFMLFSYLLMKNGPLERGDRYVFIGKWKQPKPE
ncbi:hypothetical protein [Salicibibacter kimchii]|uniref:DUF4052 domain-containing protein n=1 Tax=Salicibibacter kimchii TaxID=2099786 RepID=A0A345C2F0_9BACI|nr:hypothetical protein [Salicibibacter kimchii]AXF57381.1 hypothetical protein DT065_16200 [Salicibibacter kimchii]